MIRLSLSLLLAAAAVQARSLTVERFHADVRVESSGRVHVTERIDVRFRGRWNGIYRYIPYRVEYPNGIRRKIRLEVEAVEDGEGRALWHEKKREGGNVFLKIRVPGAHDTERTVVIRYAARHALLSYDGWDELYWNVTGSGWPVRMRHASAEVRLPEDVELDDIRTHGFTGAYGAQGTDFVTDTLADGALRFETTRELYPHEGLTIVVGIPVGHVRHPTTSQLVAWFIEDNWTLALPVLALLLWFAFWWFHGRDKLPDTTVVAEYEPPFDLTPTEVGVIADERLHDRDLTACVIDLAVRGYLKIHEEEDDYRLVRRRGVEDDRDLRPFERRMLRTLFPGKRTESRLSGCKIEFCKQRDRIRSDVMRSLVKEKYFVSRPDHVRLLWYTLFWLALGLLFVLGLIFATSVYYWIVLVPCAATMFLTCRVMPRRRRKGLEALRRIRGMEEYLRTAERERMRNLPRHHFEKLLPFAIALDLHDVWTEAFAALYTKPPEWYAAGNGRFYLHGSLNGFLSESRSAVAYVPRTASSGGSGGWSGGSGFSGGGFSGGGFGGGGGGGW